MVAEGLVEGPHYTEMVRHMLVDPAISRLTAARTAIVVTGAAPDGRKFVLDTWADRCQPFTMFEKIFELQDKWDCESTGIESVQYQRAIKPFLEAEAQRRGRWINVRPLQPDVRVKKEGRIRALQPYFERGQIFFRREMRELLGEYESFPVGATVDILDALAYGPFVWDLDEDERAAPGRARIQRVCTKRPFGRNGVLIMAGGAAPVTGSTPVMPTPAAPSMSAAGGGTRADEMVYRVVER
jgi:predicted phage terminase large subunit-like protein